MPTSSTSPPTPTIPNAQKSKLCSPCWSKNLLRRNNESSTQSCFSRRRGHDFSVFWHEPDEGAGACTHSPQTGSTEAGARQAGAAQERHRGGAGGGTESLCTGTDPGSAAGHEGLGYDRSARETHHRSIRRRRNVHGHEARSPSQEARRLSTRRHRSRRPESPKDHPPARHRQHREASKSGSTADRPTRFRELRLRLPGQPSLSGKFLWREYLRYLQPRKCHVAT